MESKLSTAFSTSLLPVPAPIYVLSFLIRVGGKLRRLMLLLLGSLLLGIGVLASPVGRVIDRGLSTHLSQMNVRREHHQLTKADIVECQIIYNGIILAGRLVSPEGSAIVSYYLSGKGGELWLSSSYLQTSPIIKRSWHSLKVGQRCQVSFQQAEDWRLSYALNPLSLRRSEHEILLWQWIKFSSNPKAVTVLNYGLGRIKIPDALIHVMHPTPFMVRAKWKI